MQTIDNHCQQLLFPLLSSYNIHDKLQKKAGSRVNITRQLPEVVGPSTKQGTLHPVVLVELQRRVAVLPISATSGLTLRSSVGGDGLIATVTVLLNREIRVLDYPINPDNGVF